MITSQEHLDYLDRVSTGDDPPITYATAMRAATAWLMIKDAMEGRMPVPAACTGPFGEMLYA